MKIYPVLPDTALGPLQLWCVDFRSPYYDSDPRMPGRVDVSPSYFVLATGYFEAIQACQERIDKVIDQHDLKGESMMTTARPVPLELLVPGVSDEFLSGKPSYSRGISKVTLAESATATKYRLVICLIEDEGETT